MGIGWRDRAPEVTAGGDEVTYLSLSHSLEYGRYRDEFIAGTPPHLQYPPGNPVWLLAIRKIAGPGLDPTRAANLILLALTAILIGDAVRRLTGPWVGVGAAAVVVLNVPLLEIAGTVLSESLYIALATLSLWAALRTDEHQRRRWWIMALGFGGAAFLTRTVGIVVLGGILTWCLLRRRWSLAAASGLLSAGVVAGWMSYLRLQGPSPLSTSYLADLAPYVDQTSPIAVIARSAWRSLEFYVRYLPSSLRVPTLQGTPIDNIAWYLVLAVCGGVGLWILLRRWPAAAVSLLLSCGVLLLWSWRIERLLLPLLPVGIAAILVGAFGIARPLGSRAPTLIATALAGVISGSALLALLQNPRWTACERTAPYEDPSCFNPNATSLVRAAWVIRDRLPANAVIATLEPAVVHYFSGRQTFPLPKALELLDGATAQGTPPVVFTHLLTETVLESNTTAPVEMVRYCTALQVATPVEPPFFLFRVSGGPSGGDACYLWEHETEN